MEILFFIGFICFLVWIGSPKSSNKKYEPDKLKIETNELLKAKEDEIARDENFAKCCKLIDNKQNIFITGGAGVGKSTLLKKIIKFYPKIALTSTTGISACNINGVTIHSFCGVGICDKPIGKTVSNITKNTELYKTLKSCEIIAVDEISMLGYKHFEYIDKVLKIIRNSLLPFGGIQLIIVGDFFQLPPVNDDFVFVNDNALWRSFNFQILELTKIWRQKEFDFIENLNKIRIGNVDDNVINFFKSNVKKNSSKYDDLTHFYPHRKTVANFNKKCLEKLNTTEIAIYADNCKGFYINDKFYKERNLTASENFNEDFSSGGNYDEDLISKLSKNTLSRHKLILKENCKIMITKNLSNNIVNGTIGIFKKYDNEALYIEINGVTVAICKQKFELKLNQRESVIREQFPVILAYALTVHKAQGLTLNAAVIELNKIFACGQAYVAMSRVISKDNLIILDDFSANCIKTSDKVKEFYKRIAQNYANALRT